MNLSFELGSPFGFFGKHSTLSAISKQAERCRASRRVATGDSRRGYCSAVVDSGVFVNNVFVGFGVALFVINIPAESFEERVEKLATDLCFVVVAGLVGVAIAVKAINEVEHLLRNRWIFICARHGCLVPEKPAVSNPELRPTPQRDRRDSTHGKSPLHIGLLIDAPSAAMHGTTTTAH
jgi:hypothetical protein